MVNKPLEIAFQHVRVLAAVHTARDSEDRELLERFVGDKDEAAFTALVERHGPTVLGVCRRALRNAHDAEDACQATFLVLARRAATVRKAASLSSWLHGVACRVAANLKRERLRRCRREREVRTPPSPDPATEVSWREVRAALDEELGRLPEALRAPLILCYLEGRTRDEAARRLNLSVGCLHGRLERGRRLLCDRLARRGLTLSAALLAAAPGEGAARVALSPTTVLFLSGAAARFAARRSVAVPANVLSLAQEALKSMYLTNLKFGLSAACAGLLLAALGGALASVGTAPAARETLGAEPDNVALDADGRPLPEGAVRRLGSRKFRIEGRNKFVLPTPDGKHVLVQPKPSVTGRASQGLMLLDADTGLRVRAFEDGRRVPVLLTYQAVRPAAFSPDGKTLYAVARHKDEQQASEDEWGHDDSPCKRVLLVWDVATGKLKAEWPLPSGGWFPSGTSLLGANVTPDGKRVYVSGSVRMRVNADRTLGGVPGLHVLDAATGERLATWDGAGHPVGMIAGGREVVTVRRGAAISVRDAETGNEVRTFPVRGAVPDVTVSPDGKTLAAVVVLQEKDDPMACEIRLWEAASGREVRRLTAGPKTVRYSSARVVFAADGKTLYLAGFDRVLRWDLSDGRELPDWPAHNGRIADLLRRPGTNELVSAGAWDGALRRWDAATGKALSATDAYVGEVAAARTPDGKGLVAVDADGRLDVWDVTTGRVTKALRTPGRKRHELLFTPDGRHLLVAAQTGPNTVWDLTAGKQVGEFEPPPKKDPKADDSWWATLGFSPDGSRLTASKFGHGTGTWAWPERKILWHDVREQECCFWPDGDRLVCSGWHGALEVRDSQTGAVKRTVPDSGATHVAYSHDGRRMVTAHLNGAWRVRDGDTGEVLKEVGGFQHAWRVAFSPSGWLFAAAVDNSVWVYDTASWQEVARFDGHDGTVRAVFFGPDEATLVSASAEDGTALVWSLEPPAGRGPIDPEKLWADLAGDGPAVRRAVWGAVRHPEVAVRLFREKWPVPKNPLDPGRVGKLIADLDGNAFAEREAATAELEKLGRRAEAALRKAAADSGSAEVKRRAETILARWAPLTTAEYSTEDARELRAVWALELAGTPEARRLLAEWAEARVGNRLCEEAASAVQRSRRQRPDGPGNRF